jgi:two-component system sensor histidine kinase YesM
MGFQKKILLSYMIFIVLPVLVISYFIFYNFYVEKRSETIKFLKQSGMQSTVRVDNYFMQMDSITKDPLYDREILKDLKESNNISTNTISDEFDMDEVFSSFLNKILLYDENIYAVFFMNNYGDYVYRFINTTLSDIYSPKDELWYKNCLKKEGDISIEPTSKYFDDELIFNKNQTYSFITSRTIKDVDSGTKNLGMLAIFTDVQFLDNIARELKYYDNERIIMVDENDNICYDNIQTNIGKKTSELPFNYNNQFIEINSVKYKSIIIESDYVKWKIIRLIPKNELFDSIYETQNRYIFLALIFFVLTLILAFYVTSILNKPVSEITNIMRLIEKGNLDKRCNIIYDDEIGQIGKRFNSMMDKIDELYKKIHHAEIRKKEAENNFLQAQINPHFIYNTLESIRMMAEINDDIQTAKMTVMLGRLLRYGVNVREQIVTVENEINYIKDYINLQNIRFSNRYILKISIDKNLYNLNIPKLIFQPIIENAIYYAFEDMSENCILKIYGYILDRKAIFEISDNGKGISKNEMELLNYNIKNNIDVAKNGNGIGLSNVNERINIIYNLDYGIKIEKNKVKGTKIKFYLPY